MEYYISSPLFFVFRIIEFFTQFILIFTITNVKTSIKMTLLGSILFATIFEITKVKVPQYLTSLLAYLIITLIIRIVFKMPYKKAIWSCVITGVFVAITDCIICTGIVNICNLQSFEEMSKSNFFMGIAKILISITTLSLILLIKRHQANSELYKIENIKNNTVIINAIITFALLIPNLIMILYYNDNKPLPLFVIIINIVAIIGNFLINIHSVLDSIKHVQAEEELITEKTYNHTLQELVDSLRTFKHDYNNTLQTIHGYIFTEDMQGLKTFFNQILAESKTITALDRLNPELFRNPSLFGLVTAKFEYARKKDVTVNFEIYADLNNMDIKTYDFTRTLGIFLDNAIEASAGSEKKVVNFYVVERNNKITIEISNSFSDTGLQLDDINKKGVSSKGENRGLGLYKVKDILSRYPKIKHETTATNGMFLQRLIIDKIKLPVS